MAEANAGGTAKVEKVQKANPWLAVREPLRDTSHQERNRPQYNLWFGCISVMNNAMLVNIAGIVKVFSCSKFPKFFSLTFGRKIEAYEGCHCHRKFVHIHFLLRVMGEVKREIIYQMACSGFQKMQLIPSTVSDNAFPHLASVWKLPYLFNTNMFLLKREDNDRLAEKMYGAQLMQYPELNS